MTRQTITNHSETFLINRFCGSDPIYQAVLWFRLNISTILKKDPLPREDSDAPIESFWEAVLVEIRPFLY